MTNDLDTLLTALHVELDDHVVPPRMGRGRRPRLTDAELLTLAVAQVLLGVHTEHRWIRFAHRRLRHLFRPNNPTAPSGCAPPRRCWRRRSPTWPG